MPPAPRGSTISYTPKREPGVRVTDANYTRETSSGSVFGWHDSYLEPAQLDNGAVAVGLEDLQLSPCSAAGIHPLDRSAPLARHERRNPDGLERATSK